MRPKNVINQILQILYYLISTLEEDEQCIEVPKENCVSNKIQPQLITRPIVKKSCTKLPENDFMSETIIDMENTYGKYLQCIALES